VEVAAGIGAADDHGGELGVFPDHFVAHRRLEILPM
jgi:hypothetical protein